MTKLTKFHTWPSHTRNSHSRSWGKSISWSANSLPHYFNVSCCFKYDKTQTNSFPLQNFRSKWAGWRSATSWRY